MYFPFPCNGGGFNFAISGFSCVSFLMRRCSTPHIHNSNLEDCLRLGRNYTLAVTETVRRSELLHLTPKEYPASDKYVKRNYSSPWYRRDQAALVTVCRRSDICLGSTPLPGAFGAGLGPWMLSRLQNYLQQLRIP